MNRFVTSCFLALLLCACAAEDEDQAKQEEPAKKETGAIVQAVEAQQQNVKKAKDLENQLQDNFEQRKQELDQQTEDQDKDKDG
jgi:hypothetical protein